MQCYEGALLVAGSIAALIICPVHLAAVLVGYIVVILEVFALLVDSVVYVVVGSVAVDAIVVQWLYFCSWLSLFVHTGATTAISSFFNLFWLIKK